MERGGVEDQPKPPAQFGDFTNYLSAVTAPAALAAPWKELSKISPEFGCESHGMAYVL